jgi:hypothetical protein
MASAYVFNTTIFSRSLFIDQAPAGNLPGASPSEGYAPPSTTFGFDPSGGGSESQFGAQTSLWVQTATGATQAYQVDAGQVPPGQDIQLYLFSGHAVLSWGTTEAILTPSG